MFLTDWNQLHRVALYFQNHRSNNQSKVTEDMHLNDQPAVSGLCLPVYVTAKVHTLQTAEHVQRHGAGERNAGNDQYEWMETLSQSPTGRFKWSKSQSRLLGGN